MLPSGDTLLIAGLTVADVKEHLLSHASMVLNAV